MLFSHFQETIAVPSHFKLFHPFFLLPNPKFPQLLFSPHQVPSAHHPHAYLFRLLFFWFFFFLISSWFHQPIIPLLFDTSNHLPASVFTLIPLLHWLHMTFITCFDLLTSSLLAPHFFPPFWFHLPTFPHTIWFNLLNTSSYHTHPHLYSGHLSLTI